MSSLLRAAAGAACAWAAWSVTAAPVPFTVRDSVETPRFMQDQARQLVRMSPDRRRYLAVLYRGDVERNGNWWAFVSGTTDSLEQAAAGKVVAHLFTTEFRIDAFLFNRFVWLGDNHRVAFLWSDGTRPTQVAVMDLRTGELRTVTDHPRDVTEFDISPDGGTVAFVAAVRPADYAPRFGDRAIPEFSRLLESGFTIGSQTGISQILHGYPDRRAEGYYVREAYVQRGGRVRKLEFDGYTMATAFFPRLSPDATRAAFLVPVRSVDQRWTESQDVLVRRHSRALRERPEEPSPLQRLLIADAEATHDVAVDEVVCFGASVRWSSDGRRLVLDNGSRNPACRALEFDAASGRRLEGLEVAAPAAQTTTGRVRVEVREGPMTPPALVAVDLATGAQKTILETLPRATERFRLGHVENITWQDSGKVAHRGRLYYPADYVAGRRYPLVILTIAPTMLRDDQFSLRGAESISSVVSIAQPLANRGMAVLVTSAFPEDRSTVTGARSTPREKALALTGYESAVDHLEHIGLVDARRVGLSGFSRTGSYVQYAIANATRPFAAAISADNVTHSYLEYLLGYHRFGMEESERVNGGVPIGAGLDAWRENAPAFRTDRIRTPLRMEVDDGGLMNVLTMWEIFQLLRVQGKPVELYVIPDVYRGSHGLVLPKQQLASLEGAVDWFDFWLNGREESHPRKAAQYERWRTLRRPTTEAARTGP